MDSITFDITNNAWINNGLVRLILELEKHFPNEVSINRNGNSVELIALEGDILIYLTKVVQYLAAYGTYNYSQIFKSINKNLNMSFAPPSDYPKEKSDPKKKLEISKEIRDEFKNFDNRTVNSKEQIWKMRMSYINKPKNYFEIGLNFESSNVYTKLLNNEPKTNICPCCGAISKNMIDILQSINPLINEHHNNEEEGFSTNIRKKNKFCPNCIYLSYISVFDKYIPFYRNNSDKLILALPNVYDLEILEKIATNLSLTSQFIDFANPEVIKYNSNIKNFTSNISNSAALLSLLHNIQNNFSKYVVNEIEDFDDLFQTLSQDELMEIVDWIFITKDSFSIDRIKANNNVYKILEANFDSYGGKIFLVNDFFNKINFNGFSPYQIDKFFKSFLDLNHEEISYSLFEMLKSDVSFYNGNYSIYLFKEKFLNQIMGEILMLNEEFKKACKSIAGIIGQAFYTDIGLLSKFAYATDEQTFKEYIEEAFFLLAKKSALGSKTFYSNGKELEIFFDGLNNNNFRETKSYFVSFMSSNALYEKYKKTNGDD